MEYYSRLERGDAAGVSESILDAIAGALQLDEAERRHLLDLVRTAGATRAPRRRTPVAAVRPTVQHVLDAITAAPAIVHDGRLNHLGGNALGKALFSPFFATGDEQPNSARYTFLDPRAPQFFRDWDKAADDTVAILRAEAGRDPYDRNLSDLIGELSTRSEEFRSRWASHESASTPPAPSGCSTRSSATSTSPTSRSPAPDQPAPAHLRRGARHSPSHDALNLLASYAATHRHADPTGPRDAHPRALHRSRRLRNGGGAGTARR